ncbi:MAG: hypothetical protein QNJ90_16185 [Planctomycetota bacterium]|nr:hypothetical protein [Planctomycetota bacterium]
MLENKKFVAWANENIVVVVGHTETGHPTEIEDDKGKKTPGCPLYKGLTCEQHRALPGECRNPEDGLPKLESTNLMPNSWLVFPDGTVTQVESAVQQVPGKIEDLVAEKQKEIGKHLTWKKYTKYSETFATFDEALGADKLKDALKALKKVEKDTKKLPEGMVAEVDKRVDGLNKAAQEKLASIQDGEDEVAAKIKAANKLKNEVAARLKRGYLPVVEEIKDWVKRAKAGELDGDAAKSDEGS